MKTETIIEPHMSHFVGFRELSLFSKISKSFPGPEWLFEVLKALFSPTFVLMVKDSDFESILGVCNIAQFMFILNHFPSLK